MAYSVGGKVQASDINGFLYNNTPNLNAIWGSGSGSTGYGQPIPAAVAVGDKVRAVTWAALFNAINSAGSLQGVGGSIIPMNPFPAVGNIIKYYPAISTNLSTISGASASTITVQGSSTNSSVTNTTAWSDKLTATFTVAFADHNAARYFFNGGGQLGVSASHPNVGGMNTVISQICTAMGTTWMSSPTSGTVSIAGTNWHGIDQLGGTQPTLATVNTNYGFYAWNSTLTQVLQQFTGTYNYHGYGVATFGQIKVAYDGSGTVTIQVIFDEVPNGQPVAPNTVVNVILRPPSTQYLTNTWGSIAAGTIVVSSSVSPT